MFLLVPDSQLEFAVVIKLKPQNNFRNYASYTSDFKQMVTI